MILKLGLDIDHSAFYRDFCAVTLARLLADHSTKYTDPTDVQKTLLVGQRIPFGRNEKRKKSSNGWGQWIYMLLASRLESELPSFLPAIVRQETAIDP